MGRGSRRRPLGRRELVETPLEFLDWDRLRAVDVSGLELLGGAHVDEHHVAVGHAGDQLFAADCLDLVAEVFARGSLYLGQPGGGRLAQGEPESEHVVAAKRVSNTQAVAPARHQSGGVECLEVL